MAGVLAWAFAACLPFPDDPGPTEGSLLRAWAGLQERDPRTTLFEKKGTGLFRLATTRFPFEGDVRILAAVVDSASYRHEYGVTVGTVEVELVGWTDELERKHWESYQAWLKLNRMVYDERAKAWTAWNTYDWSRRPGDEGAEAAAWALLALLAGLLLWGVWTTVRQSIRMRSALALTERSAELQRQSLDLLREIRDALKSPPGPKP